MMSATNFEQKDAEMELLRKLLEAENEIRSGVPLLPHDEVWSKARECWPWIGPS